MKILLVSGGPKVSAQVTTALLGEDFTYVEVRTPQRALKVLEEDSSFDLIVADCDTHPTGGFYLAREIRLRAADGHELPPLVLLVARPQDEYLARWAEADAWIVKPVDPFDLAEVVDALVQRTKIPALPGVQTLRDDAMVGAPPATPPISTGADFRVWAQDTHGAGSDADVDPEANPVDGSSSQPLEAGEPTSS